MKRELKRWSVTLQHVTKSLARKVSPRPINLFGWSHFSTESNTAIIFLTDQTHNLHKWYRVSTVAPYDVVSGSLNGVVVKSETVPWDIAAIDGEDSWLLACVTQGESDFQAIMFKLPFTGANSGTGNEVTRMTNGAGDAWRRGLACCGVTNDYYLFGGHASVTNEAAALLAKRVTGGVAYDLPTYWSGVLGGDLSDELWYSPAISCQATTEGTALHVGVSVLSTVVNEGYRSRTMYRSFLVGAPSGGAYPAFGGEGVIEISSSGELALANPLPIGTNSLYLSLIDTRCAQDTDTEYELGGTSHVVAPGGSRGGVLLPIGSRYRQNRLPSVAKNGNKTIWPIYYQDSTLLTTDERPRFGVCWYIQEEGTVTGVPSRTDEVLLPGSPLTVCDGESAFACGFDSPPVVIVITNNTAEEGGSLTDGARYGVQFVAEWRDANGRVWRSQPSAPRFLDAGTTQQINAEVVMPYSPPNGFTRVLGYITTANGSVLRYSQEYTMACGTSHIFKFKEEPPQSAPTTYSAGGNVVPAEPPPNCTMVARGRNRGAEVGQLQIPFSVGGLHRCLQGVSVSCTCSRGCRSSH